MRRRAFLAAPLALLARGAPAGDGYPDVVPGRTLEFPRDHGAHPDFRTEWWYVTGWLRSDARDLGFQVTFFRSRPLIGEASPSAFAPRQLLFAHAAIADPAVGRLLHDQRAARAGFGLAGASEATMDVRIDDWSMALAGAAYRVRIPAREFALDLELAPSQPILFQGEAGFSRKGPERRHASYYYSRPHLAVRGTVARGGRRERVDGSAWLDHEWSSEYLAPEAAGWDWVGLNLDGAPRSWRSGSGPRRVASSGPAAAGATPAAARASSRRATCDSNRSAAGARRAPRSTTRWRCG